MSLQNHPEESALNTALRSVAEGWATPPDWTHRVLLHSLTHTRAPGETERKGIWSKEAAQLEEFAIFIKDRWQRWEGGWGVGTCVHLWLIHADGRQRPAQYCNYFPIKNQEQKHLANPVTYWLWRKTKVVHRRNYNLQPCYLAQQLTRLYCIHSVHVSNLW